ncbi:MAG TPA: putative Ig domain-containing protein [Verrucomicrobiae bacterium]|jgi:uncharacterized repeat protein (TIGR01451 family)|nr:putative Ig domain-containing protein [Verrucomicrobiae bacterium]
MSLRTLLLTKATIWLLGCCLTFSAVSANAQTGKSSRPSKLTQGLIDLYEQHLARAGQPFPAPLRAPNSLVRLVGEHVVVNAVADGDPETLRAELEALGMQNSAVFGRVVSGQLPVSAIADAGNLRSLRFAREAAAIAHTGNVTSQGDAAMRADVARTSFGVDGTGVKVGVLSDSFNCTNAPAGGATADVASGDLSAVNVVQEISSCSGATDEGRAMLQIVHDIAPGASLAFASAFNGEAAFANNILALKNNGAKVIVDDVFYLDEPMFQDGIVAQAVDTVVAGGAAYFSAAGNEARQSYQSSFRAGGSYAPGAFQALNGNTFFGGTAHNFNPSGSDDFQSITVKAHADISIVLQWDSPFFSVSGSPGTQNDLDIYLLNSSNQVVAEGAAINTGNDALEILDYTNSTNFDQSLKLMIVKFGGANPGLVKYVYFGSMSVNEYDTQSSTIFGHANAAGAEAVGAARYSKTPAFGVSPPLLEFYSSAGGTPILFDTSGHSTNDPRMSKPEITAPDGGNTTFFYPGDDVEPDGFPNFFGTSAAAPHAAALAALLWQANAALAPAEVYTALESSTIDMGSAGFDNDSGFGLVQADGALAFISTGLDLALTNHDVADPVIVGNNITYTLTVTNRGFIDATGVTLTDNFPGSVNLVSATPSQGSCSGSATITCSLGGIVNHGTATVTVVVATTATGSLANTATVTANEGDFDISNNTATQTTTVAPPPLVMASTALPNGEVASSYNGNLQISGGVTPYNIAVIIGALPVGLTIDSTGVISGTPVKANYKKPPTFTVRLIDGNNHSITRQFSIVVYPALVNATKGLKKGVVGKSYAVTLKAKGGKLPYTWSLIGGSLPAGLTANASGTISGMPDALAPGTYNVTFRVTDALGDFKDKPLPLMIQ